MRLKMHEKIKEDGVYIILWCDTCQIKLAEALDVPAAWERLESVEDHHRVKAHRHSWKTGRNAP